MPIPPVILASLLSSAPALIQSGVQFGKSLGEEDLKRPDLSIPESSKQALGIQRTLASNRNPMGYEAAVNKIDQTVNNAITGLRNAGGTLTDRMSAIADLNTKRGLALSELDIQGGKDYVNRLSSLVSGLNNYATQEARIQQDQMAEFQAESAARLARDTAAKQNLQNALGAIGQGFATNIAFNQNKDLMAQQFANQKELEQMKLDAYKSMMSGNNLPQTQQQVGQNAPFAQSDASASTGVLANQQGINQPTSDEIMASIFPGLSNQNLNSPYVAPFAQSDASASTGVLANQQGVNQPTSDEIMASIFPFLNQKSNLGPTSEMVNPNNVDVISNDMFMTGKSSSPSFQSSNLGSNKGGFYGGFDGDLTQDNLGVNTGNVSQTLASNNIVDPRADKTKLFVDRNSKTIFLPANFVNSGMDSSYLDYLKNQYPGYQIKQ